MSTQLKQYAAYLFDFALIQLRKMMLLLFPKILHYLSVFSMLEIKLKHNGNKLNGLSKNSPNGNLLISAMVTWFLFSSKQNTFQSQWHVVNLRILKGSNHD